MESNPLVTINILSYNRKDELRNTLTKVYEQDYKNIDVIVVDNASNDSSSEMVKKDFPEVRLVQLEKNIGISGWNEGFKAAKGKYVLVLDDDAYPAKNAISLSILEFEKDESIACITFNLIDVNSGKLYHSSWLPKNKNARTYWPIFVGCAFIVKRDRLPNAFEFPSNYFLYQHELPMAAEIYISGKKIAFIPQIIGYHNFKKNVEYKVFNDSSTFKNNLNFICGYLPKLLMIFHLLQIILFYLSRSIRHGWFKNYLKILVNKKFWVKSRPISFDYYLLLRSLQLFNFPLWSKIIK